MATIIHTVVCEKNFLRFQVITECVPTCRTDASMILTSEDCKSKKPFVRTLSNMIDWDLLSLLKDFSEDKRVGCKENEDDKWSYRFTVMKTVLTKDINEISRRSLEEHMRIINTLRDPDAEP